MKKPQPWHPGSWRTKTLHQIPTYPDPKHLEEVEKTLTSYPPLIFAGEARDLQARLGQVAVGQAFVLQGGDCAESFKEFQTNAIRDTLRILLQMAVVLTFGKRLPVVKIGRMAGQFAKPRSSETETQGDVTLPVFRGDIVNGLGFTATERTPNPERMLRAYVQSASTLNLLRAFTKGGYADLHRVHAWNLDFLKTSPQALRYERLASRIDDALTFMKAIGITRENTPQMREVEFYTSHEALLLYYEQALTRQDSTTASLKDQYEGDWFDCSAHQLWIGERTRQLDGAHVEFLRGVGNPIAVKIGPSAEPEDLLGLAEILNPTNTPGRLTFIARMGQEKIQEKLPPLLRQIKQSGTSLGWVSDPMHGNGLVTQNGFKTRNFSQILREAKLFFDICRAEGVPPGGVHFELTGKDVVECLGGDQEITEAHLGHELYETLCDPRLNAHQALELAFQVCPGI